MNTDNLYESWTAVCTQVKTYEGVIGPQINAIFGRLQPQAIADGYMLITADSEFIKSQVERRFLSLIERALKDLTGIEYFVEIDVDASPTPQLNVAEQPAQQPIAVPQASAATAQPAAFQQAQEPRREESLAETAMENQLEPRYYQTQKDFSADVFIEPEDIGVGEMSSVLTFSNFVIGASNKLAYSMAVAVAEAPGATHMNPLFIYGKSGLGKTHLLRAIQNYILETNQSMRPVYVDAAELVNEYATAAMSHDKDKTSYQNFQQRYLTADVLLIDDVQYFQGKEGTLDVVFQLFKKLMDEGKQVVLSADRAPKMIEIDERYYSRFGSGGVIDVKPPEMETKLGIVKSFIREYQQSENKPDIYIPKDIQVYIAEMSSSNIRELKGAVTTVITQIEYYGSGQITLADVSSLLENHFSSSNGKKLDVSDIQKEVEKFYKVSHFDLVGAKRSRNIMYARQVAIYLCRQMLDIPYNDIGKKFNRDHSTIMHSVGKIEDLLLTSRPLQEELEVIVKNIKEN